MNNCKNCKWYEPFNGVCCNGDSVHRAEIIDPDDSCKEWEDETAK